MISWPRAVLASLCLDGCTAPTVTPDLRPLPVSEAWSPQPVEFAGRQWSVRSSTQLVAAGPNRWSSTQDAAWVDAQGRLRMRLRQTQGLWYGVELCTPLLGTDQVLSLQIDGPLGRLDPNVVLGIFGYRDDASEWDIEFARWGKRREANAQFVVAPATNPSRLHRFLVPPNSKTLALQVVWHTEFLAFELVTMDGRVERWRYSGPNRPSPDGHRLHINLWLYQGRAPTDERAVEITISELLTIPWDQASGAP